MMKRKLYIVPALFIVLALIGKAQDRSDQDDSTKEGTMEIISSAFSQGENIPAEFTCDGPDKSPNLAFKNVPEEAVSLVLLCEDPDAPAGLWVHWVVFNIPPDCKGFGVNVPKEPRPELRINGSAVNIYQGKNDFGKFGYGGPCPPKGPAHRYFFRLFAIDEKLRFDEDEFEKGISRKMILDAIEGHVITEAELMGKYKRRE